MTIEEARQSWESRLRAIPGVTGVGIGLTPDRHGKCIKVYVDRSARDAIDKIPKEIEGYPVVVEVRGSFRAQ